MHTPKMRWCEPEGIFIVVNRRFGLCAFVIEIAIASTFTAQAAEQALIDAAKKEGSVMWYTSLIVNQMARPAVAAFEEKYGIKGD